MRAWADVAELTNTKNLDGGLVARCAPGLPFLLREGMEVAFVPPGARRPAPRAGGVGCARTAAPAEGVVGFEGVEDIDTAALLAGCHCLVRRSDLPQDALAARARTWAGLAASMRAPASWGMCEGVREMPAQRLLEVARADAAGDGGAGGAGQRRVRRGWRGRHGLRRAPCAARPAAPVLVPLVDAFVVRVDEQARRIDVDLPDGLLDL